jgi:hypothetical protein
MVAGSFWDRLFEDRSGSVSRLLRETRSMRGQVLQVCRFFEKYIFWRVLGEPGESMKGQSQLAFWEIVLWVG